MRLLLAVVNLFALLQAAPLLSKPKYASFNETLAREPMMILSSAAYSDSPEDCLDRTGLGEVVLKVPVTCDFFSFDKCFGFTAVLHNDKAIVIAFRGTTNPTELISEISESMFSQQSAFVGGGTVAKYFNDAFVDLWTQGIKSSLTDLARQYPDYDLWITGHSLGGSIAAIAAGYIATTGAFPSDRIVLYTFGQPRTGNKDFATIHDQMVPYAYRVTHNRDMVPHVPLELMDFYHHKQEIFYRNEMEEGKPYEVCNNDEDDNCSDGYIDISILDHITYYGRILMFWGEGGCKP